MSPSQTTPQGPLSVSASALVTRSAVPAGLKYAEYKEYLRYDFIFSCAYCTMSEAEALAIRFAIDHYESRKARPDLENDYTNLMYACDGCNTRKGDRTPPADARAAGFRFFRPDHDAFHEHFELKGIRLEPKTNVGYYSIEALDLNRQNLRRLREIRERVSKCDRVVAEGVRGLRTFPIDQLPPKIRGRAQRAINRATGVGDRIADRIDALLREHARSPLIDPDKDSETHAQERASRLRHLQGLFHGRWRAPRTGEKKR